MASRTEITGRRSGGVSSRLGIEQEYDQATSSGADRGRAPDEARGTANASMLIGGTTVTGGEPGIAKAAASAQKPALSGLPRA